MKKLFFLPVALVLFLLSCQKENQQMPASNSPAAVSNKSGAIDLRNPDEKMLSTEITSPGGYLYSESNDGILNKIIIYKQGTDGTLTWWKEVASGGKGTGAGLGSQGAVCMSENHKWLFAVNAGSNSFSVFSIQENGDLTLRATVSSMGEKPNSITTYGKLVYVLNNTSSTICGFTFNNGVLMKTAGSPHNLSGLNVDAPQIMFEPDGSGVVVTEKATNLVDVFKLDAAGGIVSVVYNQSTGATPFGFSYARKFLVVSDAGDGACTSYKERGSGILHAVNGAVPDFEAAPCWVATTKYGFYAYTANAGSNTLSAYYVDSTGALSFIKSVTSGLKPLDLIVSRDNKYLYNINANSQTIGAFKRITGGDLKAIGDVKLATYAAGLIAY